jgi:hypothetical protein
LGANQFEKISGQDNLDAKAPDVRKVPDIPGANVWHLGLDGKLQDGFIGSKMSTVDRAAISLLHSACAARHLSTVPPFHPAILLPPSSSSSLITDLF